MDISNLITDAVTDSEYKQNNMVSGEFLKVIFSMSLFCIYVLHIRSLSAIPWFRMSPDGRYNRKKFQLRKCISYGQFIIDGYRKGDPSNRVKIPNPYSRAAEEGGEV